MVEFADYVAKYKHCRMERRNGILQVTFHTDGGPLRWSESAHRQFGYAFTDIGADPDNKLVIMTGTGDTFCSEMDIESFGDLGTPRAWDKIYRRGKRMLLNLLDIEVPIIAAINGPALIHAELGLLGDIVLAADTAEFQDEPHFRNGVVPGDGAHVIWPLLLGVNRARYFLLTGQKLAAQEALDLGVVNEVMPRDQLLPRAWELAEQLVKQPPLTLRYSRVILTLQLKRVMQDMLGYGLVLEGMGVLDLSSTETKS